MRKDYLLADAVAVGTWLSHKIYQYIHY